MLFVHMFFNFLYFLLRCLFFVSVAGCPIHSYDSNHYIRSRVNTIQWNIFYSNYLQQKIDWKVFRKFFASKHIALYDFSVFKILYLNLLVFPFFCLFFKKKLPQKENYNPCPNQKGPPQTYAHPSKEHTSSP